MKLSLVVSDAFDRGRLPAWPLLYVVGGIVSLGLLLYLVLALLKPELFT